MIVTLQLAPGASVSETELAQSLGIGRTPIREALQRLAREGLVAILPRRGVIVSEINVKKQLRLLEVRRELERSFERSAKVNDDVTFMRTDREFNALCSSASHNEFAAAAMALLHSLSRRFWYIHYKEAADMPLTANLHAAIARAIAAGDEERAAAASDKLLEVIEKFTRDTTDI